MGVPESREEVVRVEVGGLVRPRVRDEHAQEVHAERQVLEGLQDYSLGGPARKRARARLDFRAAGADPLLGADALQHALEGICLAELEIWIHVPVRACAGPKANGQPGAVEKPLGYCGPQLTAVLIAHHGLGRGAVDGGGDGPVDACEALARIVVPAAAD